MVPLVARMLMPSFCVAASDQDSSIQSEVGVDPHDREPHQDHDRGDQAEPFGASTAGAMSGRPPADLRTTWRGTEGLRGSSASGTGGASPSLR